MSYSNGLLPSDNNYYHESGRSGIAGKDGKDGIRFKLTAIMVIMIYRIKN